MGTRLGQPHHLGGGFAVMWASPLEVDDPDLDVVIELELEVEDERLVVSALRARRRPGGPPVTVDALKSLPVVRLIARELGGGAVLSWLVQIDDQGDGHYRVAPANLEALPEAERAAIIYRAAYFLGMAPTTAVAEGLGISRDMAAKRVQAARLAGFLEPTTKGRKGT